MFWVLMLIGPKRKGSRSAFFSSLFLDLGLYVFIYTYKYNQCQDPDEFATFGHFLAIYHV